MLLIYLLSLIGNFVFDVRTAEPLSRWMVEVNGPVSCIEEWRKTYQFDQQGFLFRKVPVDNWYVIEIPTQTEEALGKLNCVSRIIEDKRIHWRKEPNDPAYINQQDMNLIGMPKAWDITTGGVTAEGDSIVVAIIDEGFETNHPDLIANIWHNKLEIPDDGTDNDNNGYVDDYTGYNIELENDHHPVSPHGTSVAGIIGGVGNNDVGITGVNWSVKLLLISGADFESDLIASYQYVLDMRNLYDQTNGAKGAFIVVTNLSAGIDNAFAADHPLWCAMYDNLGDSGILSVCAAPNNGISVDVDGDMPTTCTSDYIIAVTNVDLSDHILENAGFGPTSIDIGAPGHGTVTTSSGMTYKEFPGTSSATPHVTGTVALMYSTPCNLFLDDLDTDPDGVARKIRDIIFATAKINNSLEGITVTGRRLQADAAVRATLNECQPQTENSVKINYVRPNYSVPGSDDIQVGFEIKGDTTKAFFELYAMSGARVAQYDISPEQFLAKEIIISSKSLPAAMYVLTLWSGKLKSSKKITVF